MSEPAGADPTLEAAWQTLDAAGVGWLLLRAHEGEHDGDIDVLVSSADLRTLDRVLPKIGFERIPAIGHAEHRFYRSYDGSRDRWITLDVVTELAFGPGGWLLLPGTAESVLERRVRERNGIRPVADDGFWVLLLHALLDRGRVSAEHAARLSTLVPQARPDGLLGRCLDGIAGRGTASGLIAAIADGRPDRALGQSRRLRRQWLWSAPGRALGRRTVHAVSSRLRKPHTALRRRGIDIAVLGPDGAGKSTLAEALTHSFPTPTRTVYLGLYGGGLGGRGRALIVRRLLRLWLGWCSGAWHRLRGRIVVYDRHALDMLVAPKRSTLKARARRFVLLHAIPTPALVIVLDAPAEVLFGRKGEHDVATLARQREGYLAIAARLRNAEIVDATREPEAVRRDVIARTWRRMGEGRRGG